MKILSFESIDELAQKEFEATQVIQDPQTGIRKSLLPSEGIEGWYQGFVIGYAMGQENIDSSEKIILTEIMTQNEQSNQIDLN